MPDFEQPPAPPGMDPGTAARLHNNYDLALLDNERESLREWCYNLNYAINLAGWRLEVCKQPEERERLRRQIREESIVRDRLMDRRAALEAYWTWQRGEIWGRDGWEVLDGIE